MSDALWWVPSLVVFGAAAVAVVGALFGVRRLAAGRERRALDTTRADEVAAKGLIVRADEAVREAEREAGFVEAAFGSARGALYRAEVARAHGPLRDALLLQQRLDDEVPDAAAERLAWSRRISELCRSTLEILERADASIAALRAAEVDAGERMPVLVARVDELATRHADAVAALDGLAGRFAYEALEAGREAADRAKWGLWEARHETGDATRLGAFLDRAERDLIDAESTGARLDDAAAGVRAEAEALAAELDGARGHAGVAGADAADPLLADALEALGSAIAEASAVLAQAPPGLADPVARRAVLRAARDRLDNARAEVRRASGRLDGARSALAGAIAIAEQTLREASAVIDRGRGRVGADARTRLAEAERQVVIARQEPDPVAALDAARRAAARAADADALARYDLGR